MSVLELASVTFLGAPARPTYAQGGVPIPVTLLVIEPGKRLKLAAHGTIPPTPTSPSASGASLVIAGATGSFSHDLPAGGWSARGRGLRYEDAVCTVTWRYTSGATSVRAIRVSCKGDTGTFTVPEPGP